MFDFVKDSERSYPVTTSDIENAEQILGVTLPDILKEYYLLHNGKYMAQFDFVCEDGNSTRVHEILPLISANNHISVVNSKTDEIINEYLPAPLIPIAIDDGGYFFCWSTEDNSITLLLEHRLDDEDFLEPICASIEDFFEILQNTYLKTGGQHET